MPGIVTTVLAVAAAAVAVLLAVFWPAVDEYATLLVPNARQSTRLHDHNVDKCRIPPELADLEACEDIVVHGNYAYLACGSIAMRSRWFPPLHNRVSEGTVPSDVAFTYNFEASTGRLTKLQARGLDAGMTLHGLGVRSADKDNAVVLTFVNHRMAGGSCIEVFEHQIGTTRMDHKKTVCDPLIHDPNNIVPLSGSGTTFYVSNYLSKDTSRLQRLAEQFLRSQTTTVALHTEGKTRVVAKKLAAANGVAISPNGKTVYVAESVGATLVMYQRQADNSLRRTDTIKLPILPDNVNVIPSTGELLISGHPSAIDFLKWEKTQYTHPSPTVVVKISNNTDAQQFYGKKWAVDVIFSDASARLISAGTVAAAHDESGTVLIGGVMSKGVVLCKGLL
ncbi:hypothetical protein RI367_001613 [Sorochytrium milnesiophthora]